MATYAQVDAGLDAASQLINGGIQGLETVKKKALDFRNQLANLDQVLNDVITTVEGYVPNGAFEMYQKDRLAKLAADRNNAQAVVEGWLDEMGVSYT